jgi:hypothetical protein
MNGQLRAKLMPLGEDSGFAGVAEYGVGIQKSKNAGANEF